MSHSQSTLENDMVEMERITITAPETSGESRRSGKERRSHDSTQYLAAGGRERRTYHRRRTDRRSGWDRRQTHSLEYFANGGIERRSFSERRQSGEKREGWVRVSEWSSICICS